MVKNYKYVEEPSSIGSTYEADLVNKLNDYSKLLSLKIIRNVLQKDLS